MAKNRYSIFEEERQQGLEKEKLASDLRKEAAKLEVVEDQSIKEFIGGDFDATTSLIDDEVRAAIKAITASGVEGILAKPKKESKTTKEKTNYRTPKRKTKSSKTFLTLASDDTLSIAIADLTKNTNATGRPVISDISTAFIKFILDDKLYINPNRKVEDFRGRKKQLFKTADGKIYRKTFEQLLADFKDSDIMIPNAESSFIHADKSLKKVYDETIRLAYYNAISGKAMPKVVELSRDVPLSKDTKYSIISRLTKIGKNSYSIPFKYLPSSTSYDPTIASLFELFKEIDNLEVFDESTGSRVSFTRPKNKLGNPDKHIRSYVVSKVFGNKAKETFTVGDRFNLPSYTTKASEAEVVEKLIRSSKGEFDIAKYSIGQNITEQTYIPSKYDYKETINKMLRKEVFRTSYGKANAVFGNYESRQKAMESKAKVVYGRYVKKLLEHSDETNFEDNLSLSISDIKNRIKFDFEKLSEGKTDKEVHSNPELTALEEALQYYGDDGKTIGSLVNPEYISELKKVYAKKATIKSRQAVSNKLADIYSSYFINGTETIPKNKMDQVLANVAATFDGHNPTSRTFQEIDDININFNRLNSEGKLRQFLEQTDSKPNITKALVSKLPEDDYLKLIGNNGFIKEDILNDLLYTSMYTGRHTTNFDTEALSYIADHLSDKQKASLGTEGIFYSQELKHKLSGIGNKELGKLLNQRGIAKLFRHLLPTDDEGTGVYSSTWAADLGVLGDNSLFHTKDNNKEYDYDAASDFDSLIEQLEQSEIESINNEQLTDELERKFTPYDDTKGLSKRAVDIMIGENDNIDASSQEVKRILTSRVNGRVDPTLLYPFFETSNDTDGVVQSKVQQLVNNANNLSFEDLSVVETLSRALGFAGGSNISSPAALRQALKYLQKLQTEINDERIHVSNDGSIQLQRKALIDPRTYSINTELINAAINEVGGVDIAEIDNPEKGRLVISSAADMHDNYARLVGFTDTLWHDIDDPDLANLFGYWKEQLELTKQAASGAKQVKNPNKLFGTSVSQLELKMIKAIKPYYTTRLKKGTKKDRLKHVQGAPIGRPGAYLNKRNGFEPITDFDFSKVTELSIEEQLKLAESLQPLLANLSKAVGTKHIVYPSVTTTNVLKPIRPKGIVSLNNPAKIIADNMMGFYANKSDKDIFAAKLRSMLLHTSNIKNYQGLAGYENSPLKGYFSKYVNQLKLIIGNKPLKTEEDLNSLDSLFSLDNYNKVIALEKFYADRIDHKGSKGILANIKGELSTEKLEQLKLLDSPKELANYGKSIRRSSVSKTLRGEMPINSLEGKYNIANLLVNNGLSPNLFTNNGQLDEVKFNELLASFKLLSNPKKYETKTISSLSISDTPVDQQVEDYMSLNENLDSILKKTRKNITTYENRKPINDDLGLGLNGDYNKLKPFISKKFSGTEEEFKLTKQYARLQARHERNIEKNDALRLTAAVDNNSIGLLRKYMPVGTENMTEAEFRTTKEFFTLLATNATNMARFSPTIAGASTDFYKEKTKVEEDLYANIADENTGKTTKSLDRQIKDKKLGEAREKFEDTLASKRAKLISTSDTALSLTEEEMRLSGIAFPKDFDFENYSGYSTSDYLSNFESFEPEAQEILKGLLDKKNFALHASLNDSNKPRVKANAARANESLNKVLSEEGLEKLNKKSTPRKLEILKNLFRIIPRFARGGYLPGKSFKDEVPALLMKGELVIPQEGVAGLGINSVAAGRKFIEAATSGNITGFEDGDYVEGKKRKKSKVKTAANALDEKELNEAKKAEEQITKDSLDSLDSLNLNSTNEYKQDYVFIDEGVHDQANASRNRHAAEAIRSKLTKIGAFDKDNFAAQFESLNDTDKDSRRETINKAIGSEAFLVSLKPSELKDLVKSGVIAMGMDSQAVDSLVEQMFKRKDGEGAFDLDHLNTYGSMDKASKIIFAKYMKNFETSTAFSALESQSKSLDTARAWAEKHDMVKPGESFSIKESSMFTTSANIQETTKLFKDIYKHQELASKLGLDTAKIMDGITGSGKGGSITEKDFVNYYMDNKDKAKTNILDPFRNNEKVVQIEVTGLTDEGIHRATRMASGLADMEEAIDPDNVTGRVKKDNITAAAGAAQGFRNSAITRWANFQDQMTQNAAFMAGYGALSIPLGAAGATFAGAVQFEDSLKNLQAITGSSTEQLNSMTKAIKYVGVNTKFSATEIAGAATTLGQAGFTAAEINSSLEGIVKLATATGSSLEDSTQTLTSALTVWDRPLSDSDSIANEMTAAINKSKLDMGSITSSIQYAGNIAAQGGIPMTDLLTMTSLMKDAGIKQPSTIATGSRLVYSDFMAPSKKFAKSLKDTGIKVEEFQEVFDKGGIIEAVKFLKQNKYGFAESSKGMEVRERVAYVAMLNQIDKADAFRASITGTQSAETANAVQMSSGINSFTNMFNSWQMEMYDVSEKFLKASTGIANFLTVDEKKPSVNMFKKNEELAPTADINFSGGKLLTATALGLGVFAIAKKFGTSTPLSTIEAVIGSGSLRGGVLKAGGLASTGIEGALGLGKKAIKSTAFLGTAAATTSGGIDAYKDYSESRDIGSAAIAGAGGVAKSAIPLIGAYIGGILGSTMGGIMAPAGAIAGSMVGDLIQSGLGIDKAIDKGVQSSQTAVYGKKGSNYIDVVNARSEEQHAFLQDLSKSLKYVQEDKSSIIQDSDKEKTSNTKEANEKAQVNRSFKEQAAYNKAVELDRLNVDKLVLLDGAPLSFTDGVYDAYNASGGKTSANEQLVNNILKIQKAVAIQTAETQTSEFPKLASGVPNSDILDKITTEEGLKSFLFTEGFKNVNDLASKSPIAFSKNIDSIFKYIDESVKKSYDKKGFGKVAKVELNESSPEDSTITYEEDPRVKSTQDKIKAKALMNYESSNLSGFTRDELQSLIKTTKEQDGISEESKNKVIKNAQQELGVKYLESSGFNKLKEKVSEYQSSIEAINKGSFNFLTDTTDKLNDFSIGAVKQIGADGFEEAIKISSDISNSSNEFRAKNTKALLSGVINDESIDAIVKQNYDAFSKSNNKDINFTKPTAFGSTESTIDMLGSGSAQSELVKPIAVEVKDDKNVIPDLKEVFGKSNDKHFTITSKDENGVVQNLSNMVKPNGKSIEISFRDKDGAVQKLHEATKGKGLIDISYSDNGGSLQKAVSEPKDKIKLEAVGSNDTLTKTISNLQTTSSSLEVATNNLSKTIETKPYSSGNTIAGNLANSFIQASEKASNFAASKVLTGSKSKAIESGDLVDYQFSKGLEQALTSKGVKVGSIENLLATDVGKLSIGDRGGLSKFFDSDFNKKLEFQKQIANEDIQHNADLQFKHAYQQKDFSDKINDLQMSFKVGSIERNRNHQIEEAGINYKRRVDAIGRQRDNALASAGRNLAHNLYQIGVNFERNMEKLNTDNARSLAKLTIDVERAKERIDTDKERNTKQAQINYTRGLEDLGRGKTRNIEDTTTNLNRSLEDLDKSIQRSRHNLDIDSGRSTVDANLSFTRQVASINQAIADTVYMFERSMSKPVNIQLDPQSLMTVADNLDNLSLAMDAHKASLEANTTAVKEFIGINQAKEDIVKSAYKEAYKVSGGDVNNETFNTAYEEYMKSHGSELVDSVLNYGLDAAMAGDFDSTRALTDPSYVAGIVANPTDPTTTEDAVVNSGMTSDQIVTALLGNGQGQFTISTTQGVVLEAKGDMEGALFDLDTQMINFGFNLRDAATSLSYALADISTSYSRAIQDLQLAEQQQLEDINTSFARTISDIELAYSRGLEDLNLNLQRNFQDILTQYQNALDDLRLSQSQSIADMQLAFSQALEDLRLSTEWQRQDALMSFQYALQDIEASYRSSLTEAAIDYQNQINDINRNAAWQLSETFINNEQNKQIMEMQFQQMLSGINMATDEAKENLSRQIGTSLASLVLDLQAMKNNIESQFRNSLASAVFDTSTIVSKIQDSVNKSSAAIEVNMEELKHKIELAIKAIGTDEKIKAAIAELGQTVDSVKELLGNSGIDIDEVLKKWANLLTQEAIKTQEAGAQIELASSSVEGSLSVTTEMADAYQEIGQETQGINSTARGTLIDLISASNNIIQSGTSVLTSSTQISSSVEIGAAQVESAFARAAAMLANIRAQAAAAGAGYSTGTVLPGYGGGDKIPAMLEAGEAVVRKEAVRSLGPDFFKSLNTNPSGAGIGLDNRPLELYSTPTQSATSMSAGYNINIQVAPDASLSTIERNIDKIAKGVRQVFEEYI